MLLGCVVRSPAEAEQAGDLPLDYLELKGDMLCVDASSFRALSARLRATGLPCAAMTSPLPRRFRCRVVGDDADATRALSVFRGMCGRAGSLGVRTVVLGSGQARFIPPGFPEDRALGQFQDFAAAAATVCAQHGMRLALEPLNRTETNFVNSCVQARAVIDGLEHTGLLMAVDCYHIVSEGLSVAAEVAAAAGVIGHAHTSSLPRGSNDFLVNVQVEFVSSLHAAGHAGGLSIEDEFTEFGREAPGAVRLFRRVLASAAPPSRPRNGSATSHAPADLPKGTL